MLDITIDYPVLVTLTGATLLGICSGIVSCFAVLRQQSLLGDAIAHASLPGICIVFLITLNKSPLLLLLGALIAGLIGTFFINALIRNTIIKEDTALGIILSVFFGFGVLLLTLIQQIPTARQSGLSSYLFGSASSMLISDIKLMAVCLLVILTITLLFWKEFKSLTFDFQFSTTLGIPIKRLELLLTILLVVTIVIGLQTVGVILISALIIAPGTAARQWTNHFGSMIIISTFFSILSCILGVLICTQFSKLPTGPVIVLVVSTIVIFSLLFSPKRGIIVNFIQSFLNRKQLHQNTILYHFLLLARSHKRLTHPHDIGAFDLIGGKPTLQALHELERLNYVKQHADQFWGLTSKGIQAAKKIERKQQES